MAGNNAHVTAGLAVLEEIYDGLAALLRRADPASLEWKPAAADVNTTAALIRHITESNDAWFSRALGETTERNRDAEFHYTGSADELITLLERSREKARHQFARLNDVDLGRTIRYTRLEDSEESELTAAWCIEHALVHTAEHWGQIQLNAQLFDARS